MQHKEPGEARELDTGTAGRSSTPRAQRTLVKALMSQASILKRLRRPEEALLMAQQAATLDRAAQAHVQALEQELAAHNKRS